MIAHVTATSLASENKTLAHPASIDSLPTSGGQEDHVSMAPWAGLKLLSIQINLSNILAIELMVAGAANKHISYDLRSGKGTAPVIKFLNENCSYSDGDRYLSPEIKKVSDSILSGYLLKIVSKYLTLE